MSSGLFTVVDLDDPETVRAAASTLSQSYVSAETSMGYTAQCWSPLAEQYVAPEAPTVHAAMEAPTNRVGELAEAGMSARSALNTYADTVEGLRTQRSTLLADISDFESQDRQDDFDSRGEVEEEIEGLQTRCHQLAEAKDQAQNDCAQALRGITTTVSAVRGTEHPGNFNESADEAGGLPTPEESVVSPSNLAEGAGLTPGDSFGHPGADIPAWAASNGLTLMGMRSDVITYRTGASPGARNVPMRPGAKGATRTFLQRTAQNFGDDPAPNNNSRRERSDFRRAQQWGKVANRAGGVLTAGTAGFSQWRQDSANHPDMGTGEKIQRSATKGLSTAGGAWAGAKGGAAAGAALGSMVPGVGTAVGAIAGGLVGGAVGGEVGSEAGDLLNSGVETVKGWFGG